jgi:beta-galactosidase
VSRFYKGSFTVDKCADTFLYLDSFKKGFVTINGFNLGRYWEIGPQKSLYVPSSVLKEGENEIVVFESDGIKNDATVEFFDYPTLG